MLETFQLGLQQLSDPVVWLALIGGSVLGIVLGAIPGIGPGVGIALLLPVTYTMEPLAGITLLMGLYAAAWYGGAIPAITINTPGTGVNVLTTYDGHPMAKNGEPQRALSLAYASSFVGGIFAVLVLMVAAWPLASLSAYLTSIDLGMAALLAMVLVVVAHRGTEFASFALLGAGLFISTIGLETAYGSARYTFGTSWMIGGVPLIAMILGLFALSQAFALIFSERKIASTNTEVDRRLLSGFHRDFPVPQDPVPLCRVWCWHGGAARRGRVSGPVLRLHRGAGILENAREIRQRRARGHHRLRDRE